MLVLDSGDKIQGDATNATEVDFTIHGLDNNALKQLADGQLANSKGDLYTADSTDVITAIVLVNAGAGTNAVNLYLLPSGGTARRLIAKDLSLGAGYALHFEGGKMVVLNTSGQIIYVGATGDKGDTGAQVDAVAWNGNDMRFTLDDASTADLVNAKVDLKGDKGDTGDVSGDFTDYDEKAVPIATDTVLINDSDDGGALKRVQLANMIGGGGGMTWEVITADTNAEAGAGYLIDATGGDIDLTLPADPAEGDSVGAADAMEKAGTNVITVARNGKKIEGLEADLTIDVVGASIVLTYVDAAVGWKVTASSIVGNSVGAALQIIRTNATATGTEWVHGGKLVQVQHAVVTAIVSGTTVLPIDDSIPQKTEGNEVITCAITPKGASNILLVIATVACGLTHTGTVWGMALYQDDTAGALGGVNTGIWGPMTMQHKMVAGTTATTTFKVRAGSPNAGTAYFNTVYNSSGRVFGGVGCTSLTVLEYEP